MTHAWDMRNLVGVGLCAVITPSSPPLTPNFLSLVSNKTISLNLLYNPTKAAEMRRTNIYKAYLIQLWLPNDHIPREDPRHSHILISIRRQRPKLLQTRLRQHIDSAQTTQAKCHGVVQGPGHSITLPTPLRKLCAEIERDGRKWVDLVGAVVSGYTMATCHCRVRHDYRLVTYLEIPELRQLFGEMRHALGCLTDFLIVSTGDLLVAQRHGVHRFAQEERRRLRYHVCEKQHRIRKLVIQIIRRSSERGLGLLGQQSFEPLMPRQVVLRYVSVRLLDCTLLLMG
jgi:hypothetical protein